MSSFVCYQQIMQEHANVNSDVYIGMDLGGTNHKLALLSSQPIDFPFSSHLQVVLASSAYHLYSHSLTSYQSFLKYLNDLKTKLEGKNLKLVGTGGGAVLHGMSLSQLFGKPIVPISQFDAHGKGLQFYKRARLPLDVQFFTKNLQGHITIYQKSQCFEEWPEVILMSLGSGINFQLYGQGKTGIERKAVEEVSLTAGDGYFLEGTSLGAGFLMGLGRLATGNSDYSSLMALMKEGELREYMEAVLINLCQMAIQVAVMHGKRYVLMSGALLGYGVQIGDTFQRALKLINIGKEIQVTVLQLKVLQGFLGSLGTLQAAMNTEQA